MIKRFAVLFLTLAFVGTSISQTKNVTQEKRTLPDPNAKIVTSTNTPSFAPMTPGETFITSGYDYICNNTAPIMMDLVDIDGDGYLDPVMTAMKRETAAGVRNVMFGYKSFGAPIDAFSAFDETAGTSGSATYGWGSLQYCEGGPLDGNVLIMSHSNGNSHHSVIDLVNLAPVTPFPTTFYPGNFPQFVYLPDGTIIATNTTGTIWISTNQGATFDSVSYVSNGDPSVFSFPTLIAADLPSEVPLYASADGQTIATVATWDNAAVDDTNAVVYWYGSTDGGGSWTGSIIGKGRGTKPVYGQVSNRTYAPYFNNFGQMNSIVANNGVTHVIINGYGEGVVPGATDTTNIVGMAYWNSVDQDWMYLSIPATEAFEDGFGNIISGGTIPRIYPGNGIGQAYGTLSASDNGQVIVAAWQCMEYTGTIGASAYNIYPGDGGTETGPIYYTDLHYTYSTDGGTTWEPTTILKGDASVMETYPFLAPTLAVDPATNKYTLHYMYYQDAIPGAAIFNGQVAGQNSWDASGAWKYDSLALDIDATGIDDKGNVISSFSLEQNYPNPFNPSTTIKYSVAERSNVSIKVFDVLGNEITTLINSAKEVGEYEVKFDASNLSSGLYIYTINAGSFQSSRKMMLLK